jgi:hypothetical protein
MPGITITREELLNATVERLLHETSIQQIVKDAAREFFAEIGMVKLSTAAEMLDMDDQTLRELLADKIKRFGPRTARVMVSDIKQLQSSN